MKKKMLILLAVSVVVILSTILATIIVRRQPNLHKKEIRDELDGVWSSITMSSNGEIIDNGTKNISETKNSMFSTYDLLGNIIFQYPYVRDGKVAIVTLGNGKECTSNIRITKYGYQFTYKPGYEEYTGMSFPLLDNIYVLQEKDKGRINENLLDYAIIEDGIMELYQYDEKSAIWIGEYHLKDLKQITFDFEQYDIMFQERGFLLENKEKETKCEYTRYFDGMWADIYSAGETTYQIENHYLKKKYKGLTYNGYAWKDNQQMNITYFDGGEYSYNLLIETIDSFSFNMNGEIISLKRIRQTDGFSYYTIQNEAIIVEYTGNGGEVIIPDSLGGFPVTQIGFGAFHNRNDITSIILPETLEVISEGAFRRCSNITTMTIPHLVKEIGPYAFGRMTNCKELLVVPENVNYMSVEGVIYSKDMTKLVTYPTGRSMDGYVIPDSVTTIGAYALYSLPQLTEINIPDSVKHMEKGALSGLNQCKDISIGEGNPSYTSIDGVLYTKDLDTLIVYPAGKEEEKFQVPIGVRYIEEGAFANATYLKEIRLPSNLEGIGSFAFCYCEGLKTIEIPSEIMTCGESVFYGCKGISVFYRNTEYKDNQMVKDKLSMELRTAILQKK